MKITEIMQKKRQITIGYLGGSITEGAGASSADTNYAALVTARLRQAYPQNEINPINAGIGGTGSDLGVFRANDDLLRHRPDIVFVEFAVNDYGMDKALCVRSMEGIARKILRQNENTAVIFLYTLSTEMVEKDYDLGNLPLSAACHEQVAAHYGLCSLNVGEALYRQIKAENCPITDYLGDGVHPNDRGYQFYADVICGTLNELDFSPSLREPLIKNNLENAVMLYAHDIDATGWTKTDASMLGRLDGYIFSDTPGTGFSLAFSGTIIGLYWTVEKDSGNVEFCIDDGESRTASSWDTYALQFDRACYKILDAGLSPGEHTLKLRVSFRKEELSEGHFIRIGAILYEK